PASLSPSPFRTGDAARGADPRRPASGPVLPSLGRHALLQPAGDKGRRQDTRTCRLAAGARRRRSPRPLPAGRHDRGTGCRSVPIAAEVGPQVVVIGRAHATPQPGPQRPIADTADPVLYLMALAQGLRQPAE